MTKEKSPFKGEWLTPDFKADVVELETAIGKKYIRKKGWELKTTLIYCDYKYRLWVAKPGYLWDGPSYPSADGSILGKALCVLVGNRKKKGLLASSAQHDQMGNPSYIIQSGPRRLEALKEAILDRKHDEYLEMQRITVIGIDIHEAAHLYKDMLQQWPERKETISNWKSFKQFLGLLIFQPWYRLLFTGPQGMIWKKVEPTS